MRFEVRARYDWYGSFEMDDAARQAAGRASDFSGCGLGERDLGWICGSEIEAERIKRGLKQIGIRAEIRESAV